MKETIKKSEVEKDLKQTPQIEMPTLDELLKAGSHFGHKSSTWNPKMKPYIYGERNGVHIIDLIKSMSSLKTALKAISSAAETGNILIVGTKGQAASLVSAMAIAKGAFYVNKRWPGGLFTNFKIVKRSIDNLVKMENILATGAKDMVKREELLMKRDVERLNQVYEGTKFMDKIPTLMLVIDSKVEKNAIREAKIAHIPVVALVDTNCDPTVITYPIPANDDSLKSLALFINLFGKSIENSKFAKNLISIRTNNTSSLGKARSDFEQEEARLAAMAEMEKERVKALREGRAQEKFENRVLRIEKKEDIEKGAKKAKKEVKTKLISDTSLTARTQKALIEGGITTVEQAKELGKEKISEIKGVGVKALEEILKIIK
ncbi:30S ribosomal protein S2 [Candidatus Dojkabacteria bacterium]|nr:30S ribosomal protein S2 [Candidatus Dojkabacteria bacterium]